jgi:hypothetical protein
LISLAGIAAQPCALNFLRHSNEKATFSAVFYAVMDVCTKPL